MINELFQAFAGLLCFLWLISLLNLIRHTLTVPVPPVPQPTARTETSPRVPKKSKKTKKPKTIQFADPVAVEVTAETPRYRPCTAKTARAVSALRCTKYTKGAPPVDHELLAQQQVVWLLLEQWEDSGAPRHGFVSNNDYCERKFKRNRHWRRVFYGEDEEPDDVDFITWEYKKFEKVLALQQQKEAEEERQKQQAWDEVIGKDDGEYCFDVELCCVIAVFSITFIIKVCV